MPRALATITASVRLDTSSLVKMDRTWVFTVPADMAS
jgi:hypothetical protein